MKTYQSKQELIVAINNSLNQINSVFSHSDELVNFSDEIIENVDYPYSETKEIIDEKCIKQIENCISENDIGVLTADAHYGYGHPIGGAVAYKNHIQPSAFVPDANGDRKLWTTSVVVSPIKFAEFAQVQIAGQVAHKSSYDLIKQSMHLPLSSSRN